MRTQLLSKLQITNYPACIQYRATVGPPEKRHSIGVSPVDRLHVMTEYIVYNKSKHSQVHTVDPEIFARISFRELRLETYLRR